MANRTISMSRDQAEALDDLLLDHVKRNPGGFNRHVTQLAGDLCQAFGMLPWHEREGSDVTAEEWRDWTTRTGYGSPPGEGLNRR